MMLVWRARFSASRPERNPDFVLIVVIEHCALAMPQATPYGEINRRFPLPGILLRMSGLLLERTALRCRKRKQLSSGIP